MLSFLAYNWFMRFLGAVLAVSIAITGCSMGTADDRVSASVITTEQQVAAGATITTGLRSPWGLAFLADGSALITERDTARIWRINGTSKVNVATVKGVRHGGEGGLLGIAISPKTKDVFVYFTSSKDNRVVRMTWNGRTLTQRGAIVTGIPRGVTHNGGRLRFGPDGFLYISTGDAGDRSTSQNLKSLGGKILRVTEAGKPAPNNPFSNSPVWSYGHRNVQGLSFTENGELWATEFGQRTWDELNKIEAGKNYGWPVVEGRSTQREFVNPFAQWQTSENSPSGLLIVKNVAYIAGLRGQRLWQVDLTSGQQRALFTNYGRLRTIEMSPSGQAWLVTSNTDGRGNARKSDDRVVALTFTP